MTASDAVIRKRYQNALKQAHKAGAAHAQGEAYLAQTVDLVARLKAPGVNPAILFDAARLQQVDPRTLARMGALELSDLMFTHPFWEGA